MAVPSSVSSVKQAHVIVQVPSSKDGQVRIGTVVSRAGAIYRVGWDDGGETEDVRLGGGNRLAVRGTLRYQRLVDPDSVHGLFAADPIGLILRVLREFGSPMKAAEVIAQLVDFGVERDAVSKVWSGAQSKLKKCTDVEVISQPGKVLAYKWIGQASEPAPNISSTDATPSSTPPAESVAGDFATRSPTGIATVERAEVASAVEPHAADGGRLRHVVAPADPTVTPAPVADLSLAGAFSAAIGEKVPRPLAEYAAAPLRTGIRWGQFDDSVIDALLTPLTSQDRALAGRLLAAVPRQVPALDSRKRMTSLSRTAVNAVLSAAMAEVRAEPDPSRQTYTSAAWLVRRVVAQGGPLKPSTVVPLAALVQFLATGQPQAHLEQALEIAIRSLGDILPQLPTTVQEGLDVNCLAEAAARLPLRPDGGRAVLIAAIGRMRPEVLVDEMWWRGVSVGTLAECARGILSGVTSRSAVAERIIAPRVMKELSAVSTRTALSSLLGLPPNFVARVPPDAIAGAFRRTAGADHTVKGWVSALSDGERVATLEHDLETARAEKTETTGRAEAAAQRTTELTVRCERLEETLRQEHTESVKARASHERQIQIDNVRAMADLAAEVEELAMTHAEPEMLVERVRALAAMHFLEPIGDAGVETSFDPQLHAALAGHPEAGSAISVIRPGYRWHFSDEVILLHKALVHKA